ncbi:MAG: hypothetical protein JNN20_19890 [Betaproteobacteria bacterium]|nr:hypothetical protein [Betaproteobacteria bacterium]
MAVPTARAREKKKTARKAEWDGARANTPRGLMALLKERYYTRFHMFLIIASCISVAVLTTHTMLKIGVTTMWIRYALALLLAYGTFFMGVWLWLHLSRYGRHLRADWGRRENWSGDVPLDIPINVGGSGPSAPVEVPFSGGGGSFDGGGAAGGWDADVVSDAVANNLADTSMSVDLPDAGPLSNIADIGDVGDEGGCALVIAGILLAIVLAFVFGAAFYVIYQAPAILAEVVFEVLLGSPLARGAKALDSANWAAVLLKKTWKPFALMGGAAMVFAVYCSVTFPQLTTAGQVLEAILK